ncbi:phosphoglycerate mutase family protein [Bisgaard Taxon 10/6]|uniref:Phosphoglycerate mutase family protein n=1 Tax=Exercitatus varius TaxID=67857 RepID=A0AAW6QAU6_9PAST|nr:phosphoglycerate mutase family protein [Exercitatus varius]MDG2917167.1 phosphoglycerate mutase family protein [Exercitatus varius]MDG2949258.1 phosphoglycerate mutase family protein [Exercitatus varius]
MKVVLIRHATPNIEGNNCSALQAEERLNQYNSTEDILLDEANAFLSTKEYKNILNINNIFSSPLVRAIKTANYLFPNKKIVTIESLREFELKIFKLPFIKLSLANWFLISRILWFLEINKTDYSSSMEKARITNLFNKILSQDSIIVSHGFVLREIRKHLKNNQYSCSYSYKNGCFQVEIFNKNE